jgi:hypothetical protein
LRVAVLMVSMAKNANTHTQTLTLSHTHTQHLSKLGGLEGLFRIGVCVCAAVDAKVPSMAEDTHHTQH